MNWYALTTIGLVVLILMQQWEIHKIRYNLSSLAFGLQKLGIIKLRDVKEKDDER